MIKLEIDNRELKEKIVSLQEENNELKKDPIRNLTESIFIFSIITFLFLLYILFCFVLAVREQTIFMQRFIDGSGTISQLQSTPGSYPSVNVPTTTEQQTPVI